METHREYEGEIKNSPEDEEIDKKIEEANLLLWKKHQKEIADTPRVSGECYKKTTREPGSNRNNKNISKIFWG